MGATNAYADAGDFANHFCLTVESGEESQLNYFLETQAAAITMALAANGALDCAKSAQANRFLMLLNVCLAAASYKCPCSGLNLTTEERKMLFEAARQDLIAIREGKIELCQGETGADFPVTGWAEQGVSEFARRDIIANDYLRNS